MFWPFLKQRKRRKQAFIGLSVYVVPGKIGRKICKTICKHPEKSQHWFPTHSYINQNESHQRLTGLADKRNHRYLDGLQGFLQYLTCHSHKKPRRKHSVNKTRKQVQNLLENANLEYFNGSVTNMKNYILFFSFMVCLPLQPSHF